MIYLWSTVTVPETTTVTHWRIMRRQSQERNNLFFDSRACWVLRFNRYG